MSFSTLFGNPKVSAALRRAMQERRLPHALLFTGPEGVGKYTFALTLAKALSCAREGVDACDGCDRCARIDRGEYPDVILLRPSTAQIKVGEIRDLIQAAQYRPYEGRCRVLIIDRADAMNEQAQNALLKTLEEPPEDAFLILVSERPTLLLPTIRSRCQRFAFAPLARADVAELLRKVLGATDQEIRMRAQLSQGRIGLALNLDLNRYAQSRAECLSLLEVLGEPLDIARLFEVAASWGRTLERDAMLDRFRIFRSLLSDLVRVRNGYESEALTHSDLVERLRELAAAWPIHRIYECSDRLDNLERGLQRNINRQLALEYAGLTLDASNQR